jgi:hypothetical protein
LRKILEPIQDPNVFALVFQFMREHPESFLQYQYALHYHYRFPGKLESKKDGLSQLYRSGTPLRKTQPAFAARYGRLVDTTAASPALAPPPAREPEVVREAPAAFDHAGLLESIERQDHLQQANSTDGPQTFLWFEIEFAPALALINILQTHALTSHIFEPDWAAWAKDSFASVKQIEALQVHLNARRRDLVEAVGLLLPVQSSLRAIEAWIGRAAERFAAMDKSEARVAGLDTAERAALESIVNRMQTLPLVAETARAGIEARVERFGHELRTLGDLETLIALHLGARLRNLPADESLTTLREALAALAAPNVKDAP